jgi:hypothetical protein
VTNETDGETVHEQAQTALSMLNCSHPDGSVSYLNGLLERIGDDSPDAEVIQRGIDRLEELAEGVAKVEYMLADAHFTFGKLEL